MVKLETTIDKEADVQEGPSPEDVRKSQTIAEFVRERYDLGIESTSDSQKDYWLNVAFLAGHQWLWYEAGTGRLDELPANPDRVRAVVNRLWPATRALMANLTDRELVFEVQMHDADDAHRRGSKIAEAILRGVHHEHDWESLRERWFHSVWKGGTAAICVEWDSSLGNVVADQIGAEGGTVTDGDTVETVLSISEFVVEPGTRNAEKALWWIKAVTMPPREAKALFDLDWMPKSDYGFGLSSLGSRMFAKERHVGERDDDGHVLVLTYYERPNKNCEKGRIIQVVNDVVVNNGGKGEDWYFPFTDRLNLAVGVETVDETQWLGTTVLSEARDVQVLYNVAWSSIIEHMKLAGNARMLVPAGSLDLVEDLTDLPGEIVPYEQQAGMPSYMSPPQLPSWILESPSRLAEEIDDILGYQDVSRGAAPANIESGYGLSILAEKADTPLGRLSKEGARVWTRVACLVLQCYEEFAKQKRTSSVPYADGPTVAIEWSGEDLMGQTTAYVPLDAVIPRSRAAQMQMAKDMMAAGLIMSASEFLKVAEMPGQLSILSAIDPNVERAQRENHGFSVGRQSVPFDWDDHQKHIDEHNKFRMSVEYLMLSEDDREMVDDHVAAHMSLAIDDMKDQQMYQANGLGGIPGVPPPEDPAGGIPPDMMPGGGGEMTPPQEALAPGPGLQGLPEPPAAPGTIDGATVATDIFAALSEPPV